MKRIVSFLTPLLPNDVMGLILRLSEEESDNYAYIKKLMLKRFKVSSVTLKSKFEEHNKRREALWSDLVYNLKSYLDHWLDSVEVADFEALKELLVIEQLKKRVDWETKLYFVDKWEKYHKADDLAEKLDARRSK